MRMTDPIESGERMPDRRVPVATPAKIHAAGSNTSSRWRNSTLHRGEHSQAATQPQPLRREARPMARTATTLVAHTTRHNKGARLWPLAVPPVPPALLRPPHHL